jgi:integrase
MAKVQLTSLAVEKIKPPKQGQSTVFDAAYPGLALRVSYGGAKSWTLFYGKTGKMVLGCFPAMSLAHARERWRQCRELIEQGLDPQSEARAARRAVGDAAREDTFEAVFREWLKRDQAKNRTRAESKRVVEKHVLPVWGNRPIQDIGARHVISLLDGIVDEGKVSLARHTFAYLHRLFRWSVSRQIIAASPMRDLEKPGKEPEERDRKLTDDELRLAWLAAGNLGYPFQQAIQLLILTGARRSEIGNLRWDEIEGDVIELPRRRVKNKQPRFIHLMAPARATLDELPRFIDCPFAFTTTGKTPVSGWSKAKRVLDQRIAELNGGQPIAPWVLHDLRRTMASGMQKQKVPLVVIEVCLGHVSGSRAGIVGVYQRHDFTDEARAALERWGRFVLGLEGGTNNVVALRG